MTYVPLISALFCAVIFTPFGLLQSQQWVIDSPLAAHRHLSQGWAQEQALPTHPRLPGQTVGHPEAPPRNTTHPLRLRSRLKKIWCTKHLADLLENIVCTCAKSLQLCQSPLSMRFPKQGYWSGMPFLFLGDVFHPELKPASPEFVSFIGRQILYHWATWMLFHKGVLIHFERKNIIMEARE